MNKMNKMAYFGILYVNSLANNMKNIIVNFISSMSLLSKVIFLGSVLLGFLQNSRPFLLYLYECCKMVINHHDWFSDIANFHHLDGYGT